MYKKYITKYPRTHSNPEIITRSNLYLDFPPYSINLLNPFLSLSHDASLALIGDRCFESDAREEKFFFRERRAPLAASSPLPFQARDIRRSRRGGERGRGEGSHCFERNRRGPRCKESGFNPLPSRARRNGIGRFSCQGHRGGQLRLANNTGFSPGSRSSREISIVSLLFSRKLFFFFFFA